MVDKIKDFTIGDWFIIEGNWYNITFTQEGGIIKSFIDGRENTTPEITKK